MQKGWRKLCTNNFQTTRHKESRKENTSKSSPSHHEATDQTDKDTLEVPKPSPCLPWPRRGTWGRGGGVRAPGAGWDGRGPPAVPGSPWQVTPATAATLPTDEQGCAAPASLPRAHQRRPVCFQPEFPRHLEPLHSWLLPHYLRPGAASGSASRASSHRRLGRPEGALSLHTLKSLW